MRRTPVATSASSISSLAVSGTGASSCRPSRMPTSRTSTAVGSTRSNSFTSCLLGPGVRAVLSDPILHPAPSRRSPFRATRNGSGASAAPIGGTVAQDGHRRRR